MASTIQEALIESGLVDGLPTKKSRTIAPDPKQQARVPELPKWLTRQPIQVGTVQDLVDALEQHHVWLLHSSARSYTQIEAITPIPKAKPGPSFAHVQLLGEDEARTFRLSAEVRYVLTRKGKGRS